MSEALENKIENLEKQFFNITYISIYFQQKEQYYKLKRIIINKN